MIPDHLLDAHLDDLEAVNMAHHGTAICTTTMLAMADELQRAGYPATALAHRWTAVLILHPVRARLYRARRAAAAHLHR